MKRLTPTSLFAGALLALAALGAHAADDAKKAPSEKQLKQQQLMKSCNADAKDKTGDERKAFMSSCLKGETAPAKTAQQTKMTTCNAEAKGKTGDERKAFMKDCLSAK
ncbi:phosphate starvation-inducible protein PsiF [Mitsuaria sp. TWR114]|uniref:PsiF family protein n=1 Tax=Mitsuaria sp. TWR114 TaxID=2601731 RepID=UPI0011BEA647|nr:PsiF family protein [Mitsuaria sp. TWR114]TXD93840.1 phosphate starvation-inducible protein PsiF [Mitsuaria sp. TWR114]